MGSGGSLVILRPQSWLLPTCIVLASSGCGESAREAPSGGGNGSGTSMAGSSAGKPAGSAGNGAGFAGTTGGVPPHAGSSGAGSGAASGAPSAGTSSAGGAAAGAPASGGAGGGGAATAGAGGSPGTEVNCSFEINGSISPEIPTVGVVDWSTDLAGLTGARIEFSLDDPAENEKNVGSGGPISASEPRALLLGLKPDRSYTYRITATAGDEFCVSRDQDIRTRVDPDAPALTRVEGESFATRADGFIVACSGSSAIIIDSDGVVVWQSQAPVGCFRALMDWDGESMWMASGSVAPSDLGTVTRVLMDGSGAEEIPGLGRNHHDFTVRPGGISAFLLWSDDESKQASDLVERSPDGTLRTVATLDGDTFGTSTTLFHTNAVRYYERDDSYSVADLNTQAIYQLNRQGEVEWQMGSCPFARLSRCADTRLFGVHGHQLLESGNLLYFSATGILGHGHASPVYEYSFSLVEGALTATLEWTYESLPGSDHWGDVQRLPNGNTLVTYSTYFTSDSNLAQGTIREVTPMGTAVRDMSAGTFGYSSFRKTLYGPPQ